MSEMPFVSVVVAAYNSRGTIGRCLEALQALDYPSCEIIAVDNASTDDTREIMGGFDVTLLDEPRRGWPAARNRAWHYSTAPLVANIDADCFAEPTWLRELVAALLAAPQAGCTVGRTKVEPGTTVAQQVYAAGDPFNFEKYLDKTRVETPPWGGGNNVVRREVIESVGGYDALTYTSGADREFHRRFEERTSYGTVYAPRAVIWHAARGSVGEFFGQSAKFASDAVVHAEFDPGVAANVNGCLRRNLGYLVRNTAGLFYRGARLLVGRETKLRAVQPFFWNVQALGSIWGHLKGRRRVRRQRKLREAAG